MTPARRLTAVGAALTMIAALLAVPIALAPLLSSAHAADNGEWSAFPKTEGGRTTTPREYFIYNVAPGQEIRDTVVIRNSTELPLPLTLHGADASNTTQGGGFALTRHDEEPTDVGSWITLDETEVRVPRARQGKDGRLVPGEVEVGFTMSVPRNASPGDHAGAVVTIDLRPRVDPSRPGSQIAIQRANGVRVYAKVDGPLNPRLTVTDISMNDFSPAVAPFVGEQGRTQVSFTVVNSGNARINPDATLRLTGLLGRELHTVDSVPVPEILPGQEVTLVQDVEGLPPLDRVTARIELTDDLLEGTVAGDDVRWSVSWVMVVAILVLLVVAMLAARRRSGSRRVRGSGAPVAAPGPQPTPDEMTAS